MNLSFQDYDRDSPFINERAKADLETGLVVYNQGDQRGELEFGKIALGFDWINARSYSLRTIATDKTVYAINGKGVKDEDFFLVYEVSKDDLIYKIKEYNNTEKIISLFGSLDNFLGILAFGWSLCRPEFEYDIDFNIKYI